MGYLDVQGEKLTYSEYNNKELLDKYKMNGLQ